MSTESSGGVQTEDDWALPGVMATGQSGGD